MATCGIPDCARQHKKNLAAIRQAALAAVRGPREFRCTKVCILCDRPFGTNSGRRTRCPDCCKCRWCGAQLTHPNTARRFCDNSCAGKWKMQNSPAAAAALSEGRNHPNRGKGIAAYWTGRPRPDMRGENNPNWNGGEVRQTRHTEMGRVEYKVWRQTVFKRDGYACVLCGAFVKAYNK